MRNLRLVYTSMSRKAKEKRRFSDYSDLRARLIPRGVTLRAFALKNSFPPPTGYDAARQQQCGVKSVRVYNMLMEVADAE